MSDAAASRPLAERMRPSSLDDFVGQTHLLAPGAILSNALDQHRLPSLILWGPPGCGKTTLARILCDAVGAQFHPLSAVNSGVRDIREAVSQASDLRQMLKQPTILFVDEIHRFNKAQQDALLPHVEDGTITLVGATTETPSFEVNAALLSRCKTLVLKPLDDDDLATVIDRALATDPLLSELQITIDDDARTTLIDAAEGDARAALNGLELAVQAAQASSNDPPIHLRNQAVKEALPHRIMRYDKDGEEHYNLVSAFIKSMRGSDPDAAVYYMTRMLEGGEDPLFILRRMIIFASEDVGNADPQALSVVTSAVDAFRFIGLPEGVLPMTQATIYLACAPKSNSALTTYAAARKDVLEHGSLAPPQKILNAPTKMHAQLGHGRGYKYPHNFSGHYVAGETYLPDRLHDRRYYEPDDTEQIPRPPKGDGD